MINYRKEKSIELLIRFWFAGAIMYFVGFALPTNPLDQFVGLTISITIVNVVMVNPIIKQVTNLQEKDNRTYNQIPIQEKLLKRSKEFFETTLIMLFIIFGFYGILDALIGVLGIEPFGFGIAYVVGYVLLSGIKKGIEIVLKKQ